MILTLGPSWCVLHLFVVHFTTGDSLITVNQFHQRPQPQQRPALQFNQISNHSNAQQRPGFESNAPHVKTTPNNGGFETRYTHSKHIIAPGADGLLPPHRNPPAATKPTQTNTFSTVTSQSLRSHFAQQRPHVRYVLLDSYQNPIMPVPLRRVASTYQNSRSKYMLRNPIRRQRLRNGRFRERDCDHDEDDDDYADGGGNIEARRKEESQVQQSAEEPNSASSIPTTLSTIDPTTTTTTTKTTIATTTSTADTTTNPPTKAPTVKPVEIRRRPAIQQHFYDIEQKVIVRPVGSAILELEHDHDEDIQQNSGTPEHNILPEPRSTTSTKEPTTDASQVSEQPDQNQHAGNHTNRHHYEQSDIDIEQPSAQDTVPQVDVVPYAPTSSAHSADISAIGSSSGVDAEYFDDGDADVVAQPVDYHSSPTSDFVPYPPFYAQPTHPAHPSYYPDTYPVYTPDVESPGVIVNPGYLPPSSTSIVYGPSGGPIDEGDYDVTAYAEQQPEQQRPAVISTTPLPCPPTDSELIEPQSPASHPESYDPDQYDDKPKEYGESEDHYGRYRAPQRNAATKSGNRKQSARLNQRHRPSTRLLAPTRQQKLIRVPSINQPKSSVRNITTQLPTQQSRTKQQRLLDLYAVRGGITEVQSSVDAVDGFKPIVETAVKSAPPVRAHVVSVTPAPTYGDVDDVEFGDRINVRRVVISNAFESIHHVPSADQASVQQREQLHRLQRLQILRQHGRLARDKNISQ